jgi:hypothetical protein
MDSRAAPLAAVKAKVSSMHFLFKPIASVKDCIELLKVASQIGYQDVVEIGMKYLAAAWLL